MSTAVTKSPAQANGVTGPAILGRLRPRRNPWRHP